MGICRQKTSSRWSTRSASADRKRFQALTKLFEQCSDQYDFDWLLITAQGYQASRLMQSKRSPAGAIGVMQLLPDTAKAPPAIVYGLQRSADSNQQAPAEGVDPDIWFGEMERLVAKQVGMEPMTCVRNIFKYYVTYKLMQDGATGSES